MAVDLRSAYMSRAEVARRLGLSSERISQLARKGELEFVSTPLGRLYPLVAVERLEKERETRDEQHEN